MNLQIFSTAMAKQKAPDARLAIAEEYGVLIGTPQ